MAEEFTLFKLRNEILFDPASIGYAALYTLNVGDHITVSCHNLVGTAVLLNTIGFPVSNTAVSPQEVLSAIAPGEFHGLSSSALEKLNTILIVPLLDMSDPNTNGKIQNLFPEFGESRRQIQALATTVGSRAQSLWGLSALITGGIVTIALSNATL
jgi:hypothetical protein